MVYKSFTFPACETCNEDASVLEASTKPIVLKLLSREPVTQDEFCTLLDWFDKVRIGLWLGFYYLNRNLAGIQPSFHIQSRIRTQDRMLHIVSVADNRPELSFRGCDSLSFQLNPCCFSMIIDSLCFYNISSPFLFARRIGFPFPTASYLRDDGLFDAYMRPGLERIIRPLLRKPFAFDGVGLYQPVFKSMLSTPFAGLYDTDYVIRNASSVLNGTGLIFLQDQHRNVRPYPSEASLEWNSSTEYKRDAMNPSISIDTIRYQLALEADEAMRSRLSRENQELWKTTLRDARSSANFFIKAMEDNAKKSAI